MRFFAFNSIDGEIAGQVDLGNGKGLVLAVTHDKRIERAYWGDDMEPCTDEKLIAEVEAALKADHTQDWLFLQGPL